MTIERLYALRRLCAGDYLLPSNDRARLWRVHQHVDGRIHGLECDYDERTYWRVVWMPMPDLGGRSVFPVSLPENPWDSPWVEVDWYLPTRRDAIAAAMKADAARLAA